MRSVRVFVPGSIGNVGPGLDVLGLALRGAGDTVTATCTRGRGITVSASGHPSLSSDPRRHASALAATAACRLAGRPSFGLDLSLEKGLPLSGGQGGSAASAVAGAVAANYLMGSPLDEAHLLAAALASESVLAGRHLDNIAPSLVGGLVLIRSMAPLDYLRIEPPSGLRVVLVKPAYQMRTKRSRAVLPKQIAREDAIHQAAQVAAMVAAADRNDVALFGRAIDDRIAEPVRSRLMPGFLEAKRAALKAGAFGCSISGGGPTLFAVTNRVAIARGIAAAVQRAYARAGVDSTVRITTADLQGARILR